MLILMPYAFWSLGRESKVGGLPVLAGLFFFWWFFSDVETPFVWPIATFFCAFGWWFVLFKMYGSFANAQRSAEISAGIQEAQEQLRKESQEQSEDVAGKDVGENTCLKEDN